MRRVSGSIDSTCNGFRRGDPKPLSLPYGEMRDAGMTAKHPAAAVDDLTGDGRFRLQPFDDAHIGSLRHKTNVLAVGLVGDRKAKMPRQCAGLVLGEPTQREAQKIEFGARRSEQKITLVARAYPGRDVIPARLARERAAHNARSPAPKHRDRAPSSADRET